MGCRTELAIVHVAQVLHFTAKKISTGLCYKEKNDTILPPKKNYTLGLCSQSAHLWATADFVPHCEVLGTPQTAGVL